MKFAYNLNYNHRTITDNVVHAVFQYCSDMGFDDCMHMGEGKLNCVKPVPYLNKTYFGTVSVVESDEGIILVGVTYHSGSKNSPSYYTYKGKNGFIPAYDIKYVNSTHRIVHNVYRIVTPNNEFIITMGGFARLGATDISNYINSNAGHGVASGNLIALDQDSSFVQMKQHILDLQKDCGYTPNINEALPIFIKSRYVQALKSDIFARCIHIPKVFIAYFMNNGVLLLQTILVNNLFFATGNSIFVDGNKLQRAAIYSVPPQQRRLILIGDKFIITLMNSKLLQNHKFSEIEFSSNVFDNFAGKFNPIFLPKIEYRNFIKKEYAKIAQKYINEDKAIGSNKDQSPFNFKVWDYIKSNKKLTSAISTVFVIYYLIVFFTLPDLGGLIPLNILFDLAVLGTPLLVFLCFIAWMTFLRSQVLSSTFATRLTIFSVIFIIAFNIFGKRSLTNEEARITNENANAAVGEYTVSNNGADSGIGGELDSETPSRVVVTKHHILGFSSTNQLMLDFHITGNSYTASHGDSVLVSGHYKNSSGFTNALNQDIKEDSDNTNHNSLGENGSDILISANHHHIDINFTGDSLDHDNSDSDEKDHSSHTEDISSDQTQFNRGIGSNSKVLTKKYIASQIKNGGNNDNYHPKPQPQNKSMNNNLNNEMSAIRNQYNEFCLHNSYVIVKNQVYRAPKTVSHGTSEPNVSKKSYYMSKQAFVDLYRRNMQQTKRLQKQIMYNNHKINSTNRNLIEQTNINIAGQINQLQMQIKPVYNSMYKG